MRPITWEALAFQHAAMAPKTVSFAYSNHTLVIARPTDAAFFFGYFAGWSARW